MGCLGAAVDLLSITRAHMIVPVIKLDGTLVAMCVYAKPYSAQHTWVHPHLKPYCM